MPRNRPPNNSLPFPIPTIKQTLESYALAQTFRIVSASRNRRAATCYGCASSLRTDHGHEVLQQTFYPGHVNMRYLCGSCFEPVRTAYVITLWASPEGRPEWWGELDRPPRSTTERRAIPRPGPKEIDALISEREREGNKE